MVEGFDGLDVVVTGAAGGFGRALCRRLVAERAAVVAIDMDADGLRRLEDGLGVRTICVDLTDREAVDAALAGVGPIDVLVNNAGVTALGPFSDIDVAAVERVMAVNLFGAANVTRALLDGLIERRGRIAVMSSVAGFAPLVHRTAYSASKHALHGLFESLGAETADSGVTVTMVCPAFADTGIEQRAVARAEGPAGEWSTTGRHLSADAVAGAVLDGLRRRRRLVLPGRTAKTAYVVWRLAPRTFERIMRRRVSGGSGQRSPRYRSR